MQNVLNLVRFGMYIAIAAWAAIVLGLAVNFDKMLVASDLTRFVPLAIFIAAATMLVIIVLLLAPVALRHNPVSTLYELASLAFLGVFWLALGVYTATAEMGEVECFADDDETEPIEFAAFTTDIYHSQYRALEGFALINVFMLFGFLLFMLVQAFLQHRKGYRSVWTTPLPLYPWFGGRRRGGRSGGKLPPPVTAKQPKSGPVMESKAAPLATKAPLAPPKPAASKPTVYRSNSNPAPKQSAPTRAVPTRTQTQPAAGSGPARPKPTKQYSSQYTRPAAGAPQTKTTGQSNYLYHVPPKQTSSSQPAAKSGQKTTAAPAPSKRR